MNQILTRINNNIEQGLFKRGYTQPDIRALVKTQIYVAVISSISLALIIRSSMVLDYIAGTALATLNFLALASIIQQIILVQKTAVTALLVSFYGRLALSAIILYLLIAWAHASVPALLSGLSTVVVSIFIGGAIHYLGKK